MKAWRAALAALIVAGAAGADEGIEAWRAAYPAKVAALQAVEERAELRMEFDVRGMQSRQTMEIQFAFRRPDALAVKGPFMEMVALGTNAVVFESLMKKTYSRQTVEEGGLAEFVGELHSPMLMVFFDKTALLAADEEGRIEALEDVFVSPHARRLPDEELDGRRCEVFVDEAGERLFAAQWMKVWIDAETGLLRRMESVPRPEWAGEEDEPEDEGFAGAMKSMKMVFEVLEQRVNVDLPDERFEFVPPEGATEEVFDPEVAEAKRAERRIEQSSGLSRFALSGREAPNFELPLLDGGTFRMEEQRGKVVVIDFWATWCGPCVRALPDMKKLQDAYADNPDVVLVGFSTDKEKDIDAVRKLVEKHGLAYAVGLGAEAAKEAYKVEGIPCVVVVDRNGIVQGRKVGYAPTMVRDLRAAVDSLLAGETLASATPYTEEELKRLDDGLCPRCGKRHGCSTSGSGRRQKGMDGRAFSLRWSRTVQEGKDARQPRGSGDRVRSALPPREFLRLDGNRAVLVGAESGEVRWERELPPELCELNEQDEPPHLTWLRSPKGDAIVGFQQFYNVTKKGTSTSYRSRKAELIGMRLPDGEIWKKKLPEHSSIRALIALPVSAEEDVLVAATWNELQFRDADGKLLVKQPLEYRTEAVFALDAAGKPVVYILDGKVSMYGINWPFAGEAADAEEEDAEDED